MDVIVFYVFMVLGATYLDEGGPNRDSYACPVYCAVNHKHLAFKDTTVVYSNMAKNDNTGFLSGLFNLIGGKQGTEIDALPVGESSLDNLKEMQRNRGSFLDNYQDAKEAQVAAVTDMRNEGVSEEIIAGVMPKSDKAFETMAPDNTKVDALVAEATHDIHRNQIDDIYDALAYAETGSFKDPWIRTVASKAGSSAYGPVQMTGGQNSMMMRILDDPKLAEELGMDEDDIAYAQEYATQAHNFLKYGGSDMPTGGIDPTTGQDVSMYDYGKSGNLTRDIDKKAYEKIAKKFMKFELGRAGGDIDKFIKSWRGKDEKSDQDYYKKVRSKLNP